MVSLKAEDADFVFNELSLDDNQREEFIDENFTTGDDNISYSLTPLVIFYEKLENFLENEKSKKILFEIYKSLYDNGCMYINVE